MFSREHQQVYVSQLSGGEKKRLHLLTVLIRNPNFLILDEPTNDLDLLTLNVLESYLKQFAGCLVIISHDRYFMDKLVDHMFIFKGEGEVEDFLGNYSQWKDQPKTYKSTEKETPKINSDTPKETRVEEKRKLTYQEKKEMQTIESQIDKLTKRKKEIEALFLEGIEDNQQISDLSKELGDIKTEVDSSEMRWLELSELM